LPTEVFDSFSGGLSLGDAYTIIAGTPSKFIFRVLANGSPVHTVSNTYNGDVEVTIPQGTTSITLQTLDPNKPVGLEFYRAISPYTISYNNLRLHREGVPSIPIGNSTNSGNYGFLEPLRAASLSVSTTSVNGFYNVIMAPTSDHFIVGDAFNQINYTPINLNRKVILEFENVNYSLFDPDGTIQLLIDVTDIDTSEAEEVLDNFNVDPIWVREFYKSKDKNGLVYGHSNSTFDSLNTINALSSAAIYIERWAFVNGGLLVLDIKADMLANITAQRQKFVVILSYVGISTSESIYKNVFFKIGNTSTNKPRIRYTRKP
jgi:hypothetical protein